MKFAYQVLGNMRSAITVGNAQQPLDISSIIYSIDDINPALPIVRNNIPEFP